MKARGGESRRQPFLRAASGLCPGLEAAVEEAAAGAEEEGKCDLSDVICLKTGRSGERGVASATGILSVGNLGCLPGLFWGLW